MMCAIGPAMRRLLEAAEKAPIQGGAQGPRPARTWADGASPAPAHDVSPGLRCNVLLTSDTVRDWMVAAIDNVKVNRARKLAKAGLICEISEDDARPACTDETLIDTLRDLANYALIAQVEAGRSE